MKKKLTHLIINDNMIKCLKCNKLHIYNREQICNECKEEIEYNCDENLCIVCNCFFSKEHFDQNICSPNCYQDYIDTFSISSS